MRGDELLFSDNLTEEELERLLAELEKEDSVDGEQTKNDTINSSTPSTNQSIHLQKEQHPSVTQPLTKKVIEHQSKPIDRSDDWVAELLDDETASNEAKDVSTSSQNSTPDIEIPNTQGATAQKSTKNSASNLTTDDCIAEQSIALDLSDFDLESDFNLDDVSSSDIKLNVNTKSDTTDNSNDILSNLDISEEWDNFEIPEVEAPAIITGNVLHDNSRKKTTAVNSQADTNTLDNQSLSDKNSIETEQSDNHLVDNGTQEIQVQETQTQKVKLQDDKTQKEDSTKLSAPNISISVSKEQAPKTEENYHQDSELASPTDHIKTKITPNLDKFIKEAQEVQQAVVQEEIVIEEPIIDKDLIAEPIAGESTIEKPIIEAPAEVAMVKETVVEEFTKTNVEETPTQPLQPAQPLNNKELDDTQAQPTTTKIMQEPDYLKYSESLQNSVAHIQTQIKALKMQLRIIKDTLYDLTDTSAEMISQTRNLQKHCKDDFSVSYEQMHQLREQIIQTRKDIGDLPSKLDLVEEAMETDLYAAETRNL